MNPIVQPAVLTQLMQAHFEQFGISFQYPDNWTLEADSVLVGEPSVSVYSPGGAFWSVTVHEAHRDPNELVAAVLEAVRGMYEDVDVEHTRETVEGHNIIGCEINFYYLDMTNTARVGVIPSPHATYLVMYQAEDREYREVERVFQAMTTSLVRQSPWLRE
jgi:hypothetical protein